MSRLNQGLHRKRTATLSGLKRTQRHVSLVQSWSFSCHVWAGAETLHLNPNLPGPVENPAPSCGPSPKRARVWLQPKLDPETPMPVPGFALVFPTPGPFHKGLVDSPTGRCSPQRTRGAMPTTSESVSLHATPEQTTGEDGQMFSGCRVRQNVPEQNPHHGTVLSSLAGGGKREQQVSGG